MRVTRNIDHTLYPRRALADARQAYRDYCTLEISPNGDHMARVTIVVNEAHEDSASQIVLEFLNYALDRAAQIHLEDD